MAHARFLHHRPPRTDTQTSMRKFPVFIALLLAAIAVPVADVPAAETKEGNDARELVREFLRAADRYSASFSQQLVDEDGVLVEETDGELWLARPGRFRWHYAPPIERLLISDGAAIWLYDVDLDQVTVRSAAGAIEQTPAGLLVSGEEALDDYQLKLIARETGENDPDYSRVEMIPAETQSDFQRIELGLRDNRLIRLTLDDRFGQKTIIDFSNIVLNPALDPALFSLEVPARVDVIDQTAR